MWLTRSTVQSAGAGPDFPAGFTMGPLGANNILPATENGALLCVQSSWTRASTTESIDRMEDLEAAAGRQLDVVGLLYGGGRTFGYQSQCAFLDNDPVADWAGARGTDVYLTWTPER
jgi:hypothetical protein